jgi:hypothetical protein
LVENHAGYEEGALEEVDGQDADGRIDGERLKRCQINEI